jgi:hypothetical protein
MAIFDPARHFICNYFRDVFYYIEFKAIQRTTRERGKGWRREERRRGSVCD